MPIHGLPSLPPPGWLGTGAGQALPGNAAVAPSRSVAATVTSAGTLANNAHTPANASAGGFTLSLPTGQSAGSVISVEKTDSSANAVTVSGNIRGQSAQSLTLTLFREAMVFIADAAGSWWPCAGHKTLSSLDSRYPLTTDSRLSDSRTPTAHESSHLPGGSDAIPWSASIHATGPDASKPAAAAANAGFFYYSTDVSGGTLYRSDGATWTAITKGLTALPVSHATTHVAGGSDDLYIFYGATLSTRMETMPTREFAQNTTTLATGQVLFAYFRANRNLTITTLGASCEGASTTTTKGRLALYTISGSNARGATCTAVAWTDTSTSFLTAVGDFNAALTSKNLDGSAGSNPTSYNIVAGTWYALALLFVGTGSPAVRSASIGARLAVSYDPVLAQALSSQTDVPSSTANNAGGGTAMFWGYAQ